MLVNHIKCLSQILINLFKMNNYNNNNNFLKNNNNISFKIKNLPATLIQVFVSILIFYKNI